MAEKLGLAFQPNDGPVSALSDVDLTIRKGEFVSCIGPSGCGKTTLLRVIADLEKPTTGSILVNGMTPQQAREKRAYGYVFQAPALFPWRTIERNVGLPLEIMGIQPADQRARIKRTLDLVNLAGFEKKYPWQLSGGMQQRASIARALAFDADLLLMDEPFGALDEIVRDHLNKQLLELWARTEKTICFVTHSIPEAVYLSTRIIVMSPRPGRVTDVIESTLPKERPLHIRDTPEFLAIAHRVREGLHAGHPTRIEAAMDRPATRSFRWRRSSPGWWSSGTSLPSSSMRRSSADLDRRAGEAPGTIEFIGKTLANRKPMPLAPHQVARRLLPINFMVKPERAQPRLPCLVTLSSTLSALPSARRSHLIAVGIVHHDARPQPDAVDHRPQTIPVAIAPMIIVVLAAVGITGSSRRR